MAAGRRQADESRRGLGAKGRKGPLCFLRTESQALAGPDRRGVRRVEGPRRKIRQVPARAKLVVSAMHTGPAVLAPQSGARRRPWQLSLRDRVVFTTLLVVAVFGVAETATTLWSLASSREPDRYWIFEEPGRTVHFDPVRGVRLTPVASRWAGIAHGQVQYVRVLRGNAQGFHDRDDFSPGRRSAGTRRIAVFGDSFTAALFLERSWPDRVEDLLRGRGRDVELLNFSMDGAGLANWWSVLTRLVDAEPYELDGVVFAVFPPDLRRRFTMTDAQGGGKPTFGRVPSWDPSTYPRSLEEARPYLASFPNSYVVSSAEFDGILRGERRPSRPLRPELTRRLWLGLRQLGRLPARDDPEADARLDDGRRPLIEDMRRVLIARGLPVVVVHVPFRDDLELRRAPRSPAATRRFAEMLGARLVDGSQAFAGVPREDIPAYWFQYEGHWNQRGSDRFAEYIAALLADWPAR